MITRHYLHSNPNQIFVFGDNCMRIGTGGAAVFRDEPNTYGFITKKIPSNSSEAYYKPAEYKSIYQGEIAKLIKEANKNKGKVYIISKVGAGLANKYKIFEEVIEPNIKKDLKQCFNINFLW